MSPKPVDDFPQDEAHQLAVILQAIDDEKMSWAEKATEHKDTLTRLDNLLKRLQRKILTGQMDLIEEEFPSVWRVMAGYGKAVYGANHGKESEESYES